jgi:hypothetical protein
MFLIAFIVSDYFGLLKFIACQLNLPGMSDFMTTVWVSYFKKLNWPMGSSCVVFFGSGRQNGLFEDPPVVKLINPPTFFPSIYTCTTALLALIDSASKKTSYKPWTIFGIVYEIVKFPSIKRKFVAQVV